MLWKIYLGTTAISWATTLICSAACMKKLERKGYKFVQEEQSIIEKIAKIVSIMFKGSIPIYNIINAIIGICMGDKLYDFMESKMLENGNIYMPIEVVPSSEDEFSTKEETIIYVENTEQVSNEKNMMEWELEEKLTCSDSERNILAGQPRTTEEKMGDKFDQEKLGPVLRRTINSK